MGPMQEDQIDKHRIDCRSLPLRTPGVHTGFDKLGRSLTYHPDPRSPGLDPNTATVVGLPSNVYRVCNSGISFHVGHALCAIQSPCGSPSIYTRW